MAVVIHELEVVPQDKQAPAAPGASSGGQQSGGAPSSVGTLDVRRAERHERARALRVWAH